MHEVGLFIVANATSLHRERHVMQFRQVDVIEPYIDRFAEQGIRVGRPFPPMLGYNRLSFGTAEEMGRWADTLRFFRARGWV